MQKRLLPILLLVLLGGMVLVLWPPTATEAPPTDATDSQSAAQETRLDPAAGDAALGSNEVERAVMPTDPEGDSEGGDPDADNTLTVTGRCVDPATGTPLAGCLVEVRMGMPARGSSWQPWENKPAAGITVGRQTTTADGEFLIELQGDRVGCAVRIQGPDDAAVRRQRVQGWFSQPQPMLDLGDVRLAAAYRLRGRVIDEDGIGIAEAIVVAASIASLQRGQLNPPGMARAYTRADGSFEMPRAVQGGEAWVVVRGTARRLENIQFTIEPRLLNGGIPGEAERDVCELEIVAQRADPELSIRGRVVDDAGRPMPGIRLEGSGSGWLGRGRTQSDGTFEIPQGDHGYSRQKGSVKISLSEVPPQLGRTPACEARGFEWGQGDVEIVLVRKPTRTILVLGPDGKPLPECDVFTYSVRAIGYGRSSMSAHRHLDGRGPLADGRFVAEEIPMGPSAALAIPHDATLASRLQLFDTGDPNQEITIRVERKVPLQVRVQSSDGGAAIGSRVEVIQVRPGNKLEETTQVLPLAALSPVRSYPAFCRQAVGMTDGSGLATLAVPTGEFTLRITGDGHQPELQIVTVPPGGTTTTVPVAAAATLVATFGPREVWEKLCQTPGMIPDTAPTPAGDWAPGLVPNDAVTLHMRHKESDTLRDLSVLDGTLEVPGLAPGEYTLELVYRIKTHPHLSTSGQLPLGKIQLTAGPPNPLTFDISAAIPTRVHGRIIVDQQPLATHDAFLHRQGGSYAGGIRIGTDEQGYFESLVPPGDYTLRLALAVGVGHGWITFPIPGVITVERSKDNEIVREVMRRTLRARILDAAGNPVSNTKVRIRQTLYHQPGTLETDGDGWFEFEPVPYGPFRITWKDAEDVEHGVDVEIPELEARVERELREKPR